MKTMLSVLIIILCMTFLACAGTAIIYTNADCGNYKGIWDYTAGNTNDLLIWDNDNKRAFFGFDVSSLAGKTIQSVEMYVYVRWVESADLYPVNVYRVTNSWNELRVNSYFRDQINGEDIWWDTYMGDIGATPVSTGCELGSTTGLKLAGQGTDMVSLVQGWIDGTIPNYGVCIRREGSGGLQRCISHKEAYPQEQWARLIITYDDGGSNEEPTTIPLTITSGNNTDQRLASPYQQIQSNTIVGLDWHDVDSKVWAKRGLVNSANDIAIYYKPTGTYIPRDVLAYNSNGNRNRIYFRLQAGIDPISTCKDYYIKLGAGVGTQQTTGSLLKWLDFDGAANYQSNIVGNSSNFSIIQAGLPKTGVLAIQKTTTNDQCLRFSNLNVSGSNAVRIETSIRMENVPGTSMSTASVLRGQWSTGATFSEVLSCNAAGFITIRSQQTVPTGATSLTLDIGLPTSVTGVIWVDEILIQKGLFLMATAWEPKIVPESPQFYPQLEFATNDGVPAVNTIQSVHFLDGWAKFIEMDKSWVWSPLTLWKSSLAITSQEPSTSPAIVITDDMNRLAISSITTKYGAVAGIRQEGYIIKFTSDRIYVGAKDERGLYYGLSYLKNLIDSNSINTSKVVIDWPENKVRALHRFDFLSTFADTQNDLDMLISKCHENRLNAILFDSTPIWKINDPNMCTAFEQMFSKVRAAGIEPIIGGINFRNPILTDDPNETYNLSAGKWVSNEAYTFSNSVVYLSNKSDSYSFVTGETYPIVLQTASSKFELRTAGGALLVPGTDYSLVGGIQNGTSLSRFGIQRLSGSSVAAGTTVYASYNYLANVQNQSNWRQTCLSEPRAYEITEQIMHKVIEKLKPRYIHIGADEIVSINTDSRDLQRGMSVAAIYADHINKLNKIVKGISPDVEVIMFGDPSNLYHKRGWIYTRYADIASTVINQLPAGMIVNDWSDDFMEEHKIANWFGSNSKKLWTASGYNSLDRSVKNARELAYARSKGFVADGYIFTEWRAAKDYVQLGEAARYMWSSAPYLTFNDNENTVTLIDPISEVNDISLVTDSGTTSLTEQTFTYQNDDVSRLNLDERKYQVAFPTSGWSLVFGDKYGFRKVFRPQPLNCYEKNDYGRGLDGDIDKDCNVNLLDLSVFASQWLKCNNLVGCP
ncbi:MAG: hypothetical protein A2Y12_19995 [Planctomycetes bacterium GWF2_42_9]|nr:MAG: hypothetical protein A2Y12_19995 [Planctomycetes bacterium GWF2_42_9]